MDIHQDQIEARLPLLKGLSHPVQSLRSIADMNNVKAGFFDYFARQKSVDFIVFDKENISWRDGRFFITSAI